jgi:hypothetical protein
MIFSVLRRHILPRSTLLSEFLKLLQDTITFSCSAALVSSLRDFHDAITSVPLSDSFASVREFGLSLTLTCAAYHLVAPLRSGVHGASRHFLLLSNARVSSFDCATSYWTRATGSSNELRR